MCFFWQSTDRRYYECLKLCALKLKFGTRVLGPDFPVISRIKNQYIKNAMLKVEREISVKKTRELVLEVKNHFEAFSEFKSVRITIDVDPM